MPLLYRSGSTSASRQICEVNAQDRKYVEYGEDKNDKVSEPRFIKALRKSVALLS